VARPTGDQQIGIAGGYLRSLIDKARDGKFSTWPMVMALLRAKLDTQSSTDNGEPAAPDIPCEGKRNLQCHKRC